ncbi:unnamed protein product [Moneuplotes crassus]|uniref:ABC transporter domain-containing protein n=1 Tax=Euplotes crassus TaxID=5936 RepID=A0AAD1U1E6_EUPCR|nr:unnamed protein product [Moneuplotes crassus]
MSKIVSVQPSPKHSRDNDKDEGMKISWSNLHYTVKAKYSKAQSKDLNTKDKYYDKEILKPQSGYIKSGETCFIMGSSGAGKTTLLNVLCDRITQNSKCKLEGDILLNDSYPVTQKDFGKYGAYVMQDDVLFPTLTCEEVITFSARLKLNISGQALKLKVDKIIDSLGLLKCRKTKIGSQEIKGLSGGERKRTAIGVEMITDPQVLFLDEPTSGLDSFTANKIVRLLVDQSRQGRTIIATIHQPSSSTFALFDRLILLMDGHLIYQGKADQATNYFQGLGFKVPTYANPADFFLKEFYVPFRKTAKDSEKLDRLVQGYEINMKQAVEAENKGENNYEKITSEKLDDNKSHAGFLVEFKELLKRALKNIVRSPLMTRMRTMQTLVMAILCILIFWDLEEDREGANGKAGFLFFVGINQTMTGLMGVLLVFILERPVFLREHANNTYGLTSYFTSKSMVEAPFQVMFPILTSIMVYFLVGLTAEFDKFLIFTLVLVVLVFCSTSVGFFIGCLFDNPSVATPASMIIMMPYMMFGGYFVNLKDVYVWLRWIQYLSPLRYSTEALMRNEFEDNEEYSQEFQEIYEKYDYNIGLWPCIGILALLSILFRIGAYISLRLTVTKVQ